MATEPEPVKERLVPGETEPAIFAAPGVGRETGTGGTAMETGEAQAVELDWASTFAALVTELRAARAQERAARQAAAQAGQRVASLERALYAVALRELELE